MRYDEALFGVWNFQSWTSFSGLEIPHLGDSVSPDERADVVVFYSRNMNDIISITMQLILLDGDDLIALPPGKAEARRVPCMKHHPFFWLRRNNVMSDVCVTLLHHQIQTENHKE